jgi:hypothetical protein
MHFCVAHALPRPTQFSNKRKKKKKAANTREFRKRSEQKASKNQTPSLLAFINTLRNGLSKSA